MLKKLLIICVLVFSLLILWLPKNGVKADIGSCSGVSVNPAQMNPNSNTALHFVINNNNINDIVWVKISRPSSNYTIAGAGTLGWNQVANSDSFALFQQGAISTGYSGDLRVNIVAANAQAPPESWTVQVSDDAEGANPFTCSGNLSTSISGQIADLTPPNIFNISLTHISQTSVKINWSTDEASTSQVNYGLDSGYGSSTTQDSNLVTNHSVTLANLVPDNAYHYRVVSADAASNTATSADNTFLTSEVITITTVIKTPINVLITSPNDKTPPTISLTSNVPHVVKAVPVINGVANDDTAVTRVEYSIDGGVNWLPVDSAPALGSKQVQFSFTPINLDDGNYTIVARAIDGGGNSTSTEPITVVVDRLPPIIGEDVISIGPQVLVPDDNRTITTLAGIDQKVTASAVGGPLSINLLAARTGGGSAQTYTYSLTKSNDTNLWSGILSFKEPGTYSIVANAVDGAGNKTSRVINTIYVAPNAQIVQKGTSTPVRATVTVHYLDPETKSWMSWDGAPFGQQSTQTVNAKGKFVLLLPPGEYYLSATAKGYRGLVSDIIKVDKPTPISAVLGMKKEKVLKLGPLHFTWPNFSVEKVNLNNSSTSTASKTNNKAVGTALPDFSLTSTNGSKMNPVDWLSKPTIVSLMTTWLPSSSEQMPVLSSLQTDKRINVIPIALQEDSAKVQVYTNVSGLKLEWLVDPDSSLTNLLNPQSIPTNYFIGRDGIIKKVIGGVLSKQQILDTLNGL
jgi:hypothetical protein